jgi:hypothetical protein
MTEWGVLSGSPQGCPKRHYYLAFVALGVSMLQTVAGAVDGGDSDHSAYFERAPYRDDEPARVLR